MSTSSSSSKPSKGWQPPSVEEMQAMLPQYQFEKLLGRGGMGAVYKAQQVSLQRSVALKVLPGDLIDDLDGNFAERFKNEARTMAKVNHPGIVKVFDFGETKTGLLYIVMEFINGTDVAQMIRAKGKLPQDYALAITAHVGDALAYAHKNGVIHRDIKPANILINQDGAVKVADFGLAKVNDPSQSGLTKTNMAMGTPDFVAPEALSPGTVVDGRADLYAMGVMLYQMLTGEIPRGMWSMPSTKVGTDPRYDAVILKAMQTDRELRYQDATEIRRDLDVIMTQPFKKEEPKPTQQPAAKEDAAKAGPRASRPTPEGPARPSHAPVKKSSSSGLIYAIAAVVVIAVGAFFIFAGGGKPKESPGVTESPPATSPPNNTAGNPPAPAGDAAKKAATPPATPSVSSATRTAFSNFAPSAVWNDAMSGTWPTEWTLVGTERHLNGTNSMHGLPKVGSNSGIRARFRSQTKGQFFDLIQRMKPQEKGRYAVTIWLADKPGGRLHTVPSQAQGEHSTLASFSGESPGGFNAEHSAELYAVGDRLTFFFDGKMVANVQNSEFKDGHPAIFAGSGIQIISLETTELVAVPPDASSRTATAAVSSRPMVPPATTAPHEWKERIGLGGDWSALASSADGTKLIAVEHVSSGVVRISTDGGKTWTAANITGKWNAVASSADGTTLFAAADKGSIHISTDGGKTWTQAPTSTQTWSRLACSSDGTRIIAVPSDAKGHIFLSKDSGKTWIEKDLGNGFWTGVASSADGRRLVIVGNGWATGGHIRVSDDYGETWSKRMVDSPRRWSAVASSADGMKLVAVDLGFNTSGGQIYTSSDAGATWTPREQNLAWSAVASSADGMKLVAAVGRYDAVYPGLGQIYISTNGGESWRAEESERNWSAVVSSADGNVLTAATPQQVFTCDARPAAASMVSGDPYLVKLESGFKARYETDAQKPFLTAVATLNQNYVANGIARARAAAQAGDRTVLDAEKTAIENGTGVPAEDATDTPAVIKTLRGTYRTAFAKIEADRVKNAAPLYDIYVKALDAYVIELTKTNKIKQAHEVQALREKIATKRGEPDVALKTVAAPAPAKAAVAPAGDPRKAAEYLVSIGGTCIAIQDGQRIEVKSAQDIPAGAFDLVELILNSSIAGRPQPKNADFQVFNGLRKLRVVNMQSTPLTDDAFAFLAGNPELTDLILARVPVSDKILAHIAGLTQLKNLQIYHARDFTGRGLEKAAFLPGLVTLYLYDTQFDDAGAAALSACQNLQRLHLWNTPVTDRGFKTIQTLKSLTWLTISATKVSSADVERFKTANPQCKVD